MAIPESLRYRMELFRRHGRLSLDPDDLFKEASWLAVLLGQGVVPERFDPLVEMTDLGAARSALANMRQAVAGAAAGMPAHRDFIARNCAADP